MYLHVVNGGLVSPGISNYYTAVGYDRPLARAHQPALGASDAAGGGGASAVGAGPDGGWPA